VRFGIGIALARILTPHEYGLVGILAIFLAIGDALVDSGFSQALIQKKNPTNADLSTVFYFNLIIAFVIFFILCFFSPIIAAFFNEKILEKLIVVLAVGLLIRSVTIVQTTVLIKNLDFKDISKFRIISTSISGVVAIPMAVKGFGVWSLLGLSITRDISFSIMLWIKSNWKPGLLFNPRSLKSLFGFGSRILGVGLLDNIFLHIYKPIIGKVFSAADLGFYNRAYGYRELVSKNILSVINAVAFPSFSVIQDNPEKVRRNYQRTIELAAFISIPFLMLLAFTAEPLIRFLITEKWLASAPYLTILCFAGIFYPVSGIQVNLFKAIGKANAYFFLIIVHKVSIVLSIVIGIHWGIMGLVYAQVITMFIVYMMGVLNIYRFLKVRVIVQLLDFFKYVFWAFILFYLLNLLTESITNNDLTLIIIQSTAGLSLYFLVSKTLNLKGCTEAVSIFNDYFLPKLRKKRNT